MAPIYTAPQLLMEVGKQFSFIFRYSRIREFAGVEFNGYGLKHDICHGYTLTNGKVDSPDWEGVALLFANGFQHLVPNVLDSRFHVLHQVGRVYLVRSGRLETEGELISDVIDHIFANDFSSPITWVRELYPHEIIVAHDPPLIWNNPEKDIVSTALPVFINNQDHLSTRKLMGYMRETYKNTTDAENELGEFSVRATEFPSGELMRTPYYSEEDVSNFVRILDRWIVNDVLHLEDSKVITS